MKKNKIAFLVGAVILIGLLATMGCATKKYVLGEVATLDKKVADAESAIEENQKRIKEHDERLASLGSLITQQESELSTKASELDSKISEVKKFAQGTLIYQEILNNDQVKFEFDKWDLTPEAQEALDMFVETLIEMDKGLYLTIQGHTDNTGPEAWNLLLGKRRADAVMEYLFKKYHIPLHRMEVISFGSSDPIADNSTREGRAQNRRVVILVYE